MALPSGITATGRGSVITKNPRKVIHEVGALEQYLDRYLARKHLTFERWVERFGEGFYRDRNALLAEVASPLKPRRVLEFACAGPFLAQLLIDRIPTIEQYTCSNFSKRMVDYCATRLAGDPRSVAALIDADVARSDDMQRERLAGYDMFVTTSLEHIELDRELIDQFPISSAFVFSVATFDDPEHFRVYETIDDVKSRYAGQLQLIDTRENAERTKLVVAAIKLGRPAAR
jgi:hypothetical protein